MVDNDNPNPATSTSMQSSAFRPALRLYLNSLANRIMNTSTLLKIHSFFFPAWPFLLYWQCYCEKW